MHEPEPEPQEPRSPFAFLRGAGAIDADPRQAVAEKAAKG